jgi:hypothetical protein
MGNAIKELETVVGGLRVIVQIPRGQRWDEGVH